ncbi:MAG: glycosyltransferase [Prevotella sp.]|nr:glycosyltransferase [Prevotella sp.]
MENKISVIVATYNQEKTIGRTLDSILMQQCHVPYEIVIGEDCSTDATLTICQQYSEQHPDVIRLFANKENKGLIDNYFDCLLACKGQYIADCAGDDFWTDPLKLEKEVTILENHPEVTLVHTDWCRYNERSKTSVKSGKTFFTTPLMDGKQLLEAIIIQTQMPVIHLCTSMYRADVIHKAMEEDEHMFRNTDFGCEDLQVAFVMAHQGMIAYIPECTLNYSQGEETVSSSKDEEKQFQFVRRVSAQSYYLSQKYDIHSVAIETFFQQRVFSLGMHAFRAYNVQLFHETRTCEKKWNSQRPLKTKFLFFVLDHKPLWIIGLVTRNVIVSLKKLFH